MRKMINEQFPISKSFPLKARFYDYSYFTYPWYLHTEYEITYVKEGAGMRFVRNNAEKYADGDILLPGPDLPHHMKSDKAYRQEGSTLRTTETIVQFEKDFMHHTSDYYPHFMKIKNLLEEVQRGTYSPVGCSPQLVDLLESIPMETGVDQIASFLQLLKEMTNVASRSVLSTSGLGNDTIYDGSGVDGIVVYLNESYTRQIGLSEISPLAAMNPATFCRFFKNKTRKSFENYTLEAWIGYVCKPLLMGGMDISQTSTECEFDTIFHFNKPFKKHTGFTPSYYKRMMLAEQK